MTSMLSAPGESDCDGRGAHAETASPRMPPELPRSVRMHCRLSVSQILQSEERDEKTPDGLITAM